MRKNNIVFSVILLVLLFAGCIQLYAYDAYIDGIYYNLNLETMNAEVTSGENEYNGKVTIPSTIVYNGTTYAVISIGNKAFFGCTSLNNTFTIPNSVQNIGESAFENCSSLFYIIIPNSVTTIGAKAFYNCSGLWSITVGNSVKTIGGDAFGKCLNISAVYISDVSAWCDILFGSYYSNPLCYQKSYQTYTSGKPLVKSPQLYVNGQAITDLVIPNSVTSIRDYAFYGCNYLTSIEISNSVKTIGNKAFYDCSSLSSIIIPNSVTLIGNYAFCWCRSLESITIPNSVESIGDGVFANCYMLKSIIIPNSITHIGNGAFADCDVTTITIPSSVLTIGDYPFAGCKQLTSILVEKDNPAYNSGDDCNVIIHTETGNLIAGCVNSKIPNTVKSIGERAFQSVTGLTSIVIPNSVIEIEEYAFAWCSDLATIIFPSTLNTIRKNAFDGTLWFDNQSDGLVYAGNLAYKYKGTMPNNTKIQLRDNTIGITAYAFFDCSGLTSIEIPNSVSEIGDGAFEYCSGLTSIEIPNSVTIIGNAAFAYCTSLTSFEFPNSVTSIGNNVLQDCRDLISVIIPESVTSIGNNAFANCPSLTDIYCYAEAVPQIGSFYSYSNVTLHVPAASIELYKAAEPWKYFGNIVAIAAADPEPYAVLSNNNTVLTFYYDNQKAARGGMSVGGFVSSAQRGWDGASESITSVIFDASFANCTTLTSTAYWFYNCQNLTTFSSISNLNTANVTDMYRMFWRCSALTNLDVSGFETKEVVNMSDMFYGCSSLTNLDLSGFNTENVMYMGYMFYGCSSLTSLDVSNFNTSSVTNMTCLFDGCSGLTNLDVSNFNTKNVTFMGGMFEGCSGLTSLDVSNFNTKNVTKMGLMFSGCSGLTSLDLSNFNTESVTMMLHMFRGCNNLQTIFAGSNWSTAKVTESNDMFTGCTKLVGGRGTTYNANHTDAAYAHIDGGTSNPGYFTDKNAAADPEPYAVLSNNNTVLTFYYDNQKETRGGMSVGPFNNTSERGWENVASAITSVVFDDSFENYTSLTSTRYWFAFCRNLTSVTGLSNLNTENVTDMGCMFEGCSGLTSLGLSALKTDNVRYMDMMFYNCSGLKFLDLSGFNTGKVTDMGLMFYSCPGLKSLDLSSFNTSNVTRIDHMFEKCSALTTIVVDNGWSTAKVTDSAYMFSGCTKLVGGRGTKYDANHIDAAYAHIDGGTSNPGYFTDKNAAAICETPQIQRDGTSNQVIMSCSTAGASIYYTTNGTTPTENNTRYTGPITVTKNCTIKAIAVKDGYESSDVASYNVDWFKVATPTFSYNNLKLSISTTTEGATIYYTTDGSTPSTTNTKAQVYSSPISLTGNTTVKAIAVKADFTNSDVATYNFIIDNYTCQAPQISRSGSTNSIIMTCATSGATIYYTTDGTTPTNGSTRYSGPITVDHNLTIRAIAMKDGMFNSTQSQFTVDWFKVATPTFSYSNLQLTISTVTTGATIYYTTNGSNPLDDLSKAIRYTSSIRMEANAVIKAVGVKTDYSNSEVASYTFVKADYTCKQPQIQRDGTSNRLMMSCEEANVVIYYTTDGSTPTTSSTRYTGPVTVTYNCTVRAIATRSDLFPSDVTEFKVDWLTASSVEVVPTYSNGVLTLTCNTSGAEIHYEIGGKDAMKSSPLYTGPITLTDNREVRYVVYATGQDPVSGSFTPNDFVCAPVTLSYDGLNIELSTAEEGATIYYTTDGSLPTTSSETYRGKISLTGLCTVTAFATKQYKNNSEMMSEPITYFFDGTDVFLSEAGRLGDAVKREKEDIETLNVKCQGSGELNASDFSALRSIKSLKYLNLKDALFENNTVPDGAFANMNVVLIEFPPTETKISRITGNVFTGSNHLAAIVWMAPIKMAQSASALGITNPNLLIYVDNKSFAPQGVRNIVENGSASSIVLTDEGISFWCPQAFTAQRISYTHVYSQTTGINKCSGWETIALPFDVQNITHEDVGRVAPFAANDASPRSFWLGELSESGFKRASEIKAYTPYIISMPNNEVYGNSYILAGRVTFEAYNTTVPVTEIKTTKKGTHEFTPCFDVVNAASSVYAINKYDQGNSYPEGSTFLPNYSDVKPFEAYIAVPTNGVAPRYIPIRDEDTGIENLTPSLFQGEEAAYDLTGRKVQGELQRGVYIINGKKVMVK